MGTGLFDIEQASHQPGWLAEPHQSLRGQLSAWADARDIEYD
jgi:hypothetical protein